MSCKVQKVNRSRAQVYAVPLLAPDHMAGHQQTKVVHVASATERSIKG